MYVNSLKLCEPLHRHRLEVLNRIDAKKGVVRSRIPVNKDKGRVDNVNPSAGGTRMQEALLCVRGDTTKDIHLQLDEILKGRPPRSEGNGTKALTMSILYAGSTDLHRKVAKSRNLIRKGEEIDEADGIFFSPTPWGSSRVAFLFPGQGIQVHGMLSSFENGLPGFGHEIEEIRSLWLAMDGRDLPGMMDGGDSHSREESLRETQNAQPAIGMVSDAVASVFSTLNIQPRFCAGHSYGELSALRAGGALERETFLRMSRMRGYLLAKAGGATAGAMTSVMTTLDEVQKLLIEVEGTIAVSCMNAPQQTVVAGELAAIREVEKVCRERKIRTVRLRTPCAFHSPLMSPVTEEWKDYLEKMSRADGGYRAPPHDKVFSNVTAQTYPEDKGVMTSLLCRQLVSPVRWEEICVALYERGIRIFVEVGAGGVLTGLLSRTLAGRPHLGLTCHRKGADICAGLLVLIAKLASHGVPVKWQPFYREYTQPGLSVRDKPDGHGISKSESMESCERNGHANPNADEQTSTFKTFLDRNRRVLESFFEAQDRMLDQATRGLTGPLRTDCLTRWLHGNQDVMDEFLALQQAVERFAAGGRFPLESFALPTVSAAKRGLLEPEFPFAEGVVGPGQPGVAVETTPPPVHTDAEDPPVKLEDWLRNEISEITGFPPEIVSSDTLFDRDLGLDSITMLQVAVHMMDVFPETRRLENELHGVHSIEMLQALMKEAGVLQDGKTEESLDGLLGGRLSHGPEQETSSQETEKSDGLPDSGDLRSSVCPHRRKTAWGEIEGWLTQRLAASSGIDAREITETTDFFYDLHLDHFLHGTIVEELVALAPELSVAGYALQNTSNMLELRDLLDAVTTGEETGKTTPPAAVRAEGADADSVERFVLVETPCEHPVQDDLPAMPTRMILAGCESPVLEHYRIRLQDSGIEVISLRLSKNRWEVCLPGKTETVLFDDVHGLGKILGPYCEGTRIPDLLFLAMGTGRGPALGAPADWIDELEYATTGLFSIAKALSTGKREKEIRGDLFAVVGSPTAGPGWRAAAGLTRSLSREWPQVNVSYSLLEGVPEEFPVERLLTDLLQKKRGDEFIFGSPGRRRLELVKRPFLKGVTAPSGVDLGPDPLLLLTGGGSGITAALGCMFAEKYQCRIAAIGRTPWPREDRFAGVTDRAQLKRHIYEELVRERRKGGTVLKQEARFVQARLQEIERQRSLLKTAERVKAAGGVFRYYRADCTDENELAGVIDSIHGEEGPIHGFVHGAGITDDSLLTQKAVDSFRRVVHTKARSSFQFYRLLRDDPLAFVLFLSSLSSLAGTPGQTDYAAANEALNALAAEWNRQAPYPVKSLLWSVWTETGLVGEGMKKEMKRLGLGGIRTADGIRLSHREIFEATKEEDWVLFAPVSTLRHVAAQWA